MVTDSKNIRQELIFCSLLINAFDDVVFTKTSLHERIVISNHLKRESMIEPLLCGIVLGLVPITLLGLFVSAWNQYRRSSSMPDWE